MRSCLSLVVCATIALILIPLDARSADQKIPPRACNLSPIIRPTLAATVDLQPGLTADILLDRRISMKRGVTPDGTKYIEFSETGQIALQADVLSRLIAQSLNQMRSHIGETCQFSISSFEGSANWAIPPSFQVSAAGGARKCTSFSYPCGAPQVTCPHNDPFDCQWTTPTCTAVQKFDIGDWSVSVSGTLPLTVQPDSLALEIDAVRGDPVINTGSNGVIAEILNAIGLLKIIQNIDTSLAVKVDFDVIPSLGKLISLDAPTDPVASPRKVDSASWVRIDDTQQGKFSNVGIGYAQSVGLPEQTGCLKAKCLRRSRTDDQYATCMLAE
jgi:hypothetical protein